MKTIVKIQLPLMSSERSPPALVYDKSRSWELMLNVTPDLKKKMKGQTKKFFHADFDEDREGSELELRGEAPWQNW